MRIEEHGKRSILATESGTKKSGVIPSTQAWRIASSDKVAKAPSSTPKRVIGDVPQARGRLDLDSMQAKRAIQKALSHLGTKCGADVHTFVPRYVDVDELGMTHIRLDRALAGTRIFGEQVIVHIAAGSAGAVSGVTGATDLAAPPPDVKWKIPASAALAKAQEMCSGAPMHPPSVEKLWVTDSVGSLRPAYSIEILELGEQRARRFNALIDAETGEPLTQWDNTLGIWVPHDAAEILDEDGSAPLMTTDDVEVMAESNANTLYSGRVHIDTTQQPDGRFALEDRNAGHSIITVDAMNQALDTKNTPPPTGPIGLTAGKARPILAGVETFAGQISAEPILDDNNIWLESTDSVRQKGATDAHYTAEMTVACFKEVLGVDSLDLKGMQVVSNVHVGVNFNNAFLDPRAMDMNYGDGDGKKFNVLTSLDVGGHEMTHALTRSTAGLLYRGESGGLNEGMSDIGGTLVEWFASQRNPAVHWNWMIGESIVVPGSGRTALRFMDDPTKDGYSIDHYSKYTPQLDVHRTSGITNNAFYQLAETNNAGKKANSVSHVAVQDGIGMEKAAKIFFRALIRYETPTTTFAQARAACIQAATDLYGANSVEVQKTREAWSAVGVEDPQPGLQSHFIV